MSTPETQPIPPAPTEHPHLLHVPQWAKWWLIGMMPLLIGLLATWTTYYVFSHRTLPTAPASNAPDPAAPTRGATQTTPPLGASWDIEGPWGRLEIVPITIAPPADYIGEPSRPKSEDAVWYFQCTDRNALGNMLTRAGLPKALCDTLMSLATPGEPRNTGYVVRPGRDLVLGLTPEVRAKLYLILHDHAMNTRQRNSSRFCGESADQWFHDSHLSPETLKLVTPLIYRIGPFMHVADKASIRRDIPSPEKRSLLTGTLARQATVMAKIKLSRTTDIDALVNYWGRGGRAKDVRPILESLARLDGEHSVDITHLLPPFARERLYTFPTPKALPSSVTRDCHWTALNFFADQPDDRFGENDTTFTGFDKTHYKILGKPQLGDMLIFVDRKGNAIHSAVYIAGDLVFTKNGVGLNPWMLLTLDSMKEYYPRSTGVGVNCFRLKGM